MSQAGAGRADYNHGMRLLTPLAALLLGIVTAIAPALGQRAPCTGTVTVPGGEPLTGAVVTFCQDPAQRLGNEPDRVEVRTDENGRYEAMLRPGSSYAGWAIGPAVKNGQRWVTGLLLAGAAGRPFDLVAERQARPHEVELCGVDRWRTFSPPAVRVLLGGQFRCGHDLPVNGDGKVVLGPWPGHDAVLALVDDKRQPMCESQRLHAGVLRAHFPFAHDVELIATDLDGTPIAGAEVHVRDDQRSEFTRTWAGQRRATAPVPAPLWQEWRYVGRTDAEGSCRLSIPLATRKADRNVALLVSAAGHAHGMAGLSNGEPTTGSDRVDGGLRFVVELPPADPRDLLVIGADPGLEVEVSTSVRLVGRAAASAWQHEYWQQPRNLGSATPAVGPQDSISHCRVRARRSEGDAAPPRICVGTEWRSDQDIEFDLGKLVRRTLVLQDENQNNVPFAHVCIALRPDPPARFFAVHDRCIADANGRIELWSTDAVWDVVAVAGHRWCWYRIPIGDRRAEHTLQLAAAPTANLLIVDVDGLAVPGARFDAQLRTRGRPEDLLVRETAISWLRHAASGRDGSLTVPLLGAELREVRIARGGLRSWRTNIGPNTQQTELILH